MTHHFQPLDLTLNKFAKYFIKQKFREWFSRKINIRIQNDQALGDIEVNY